MSSIDEHVVHDGKGKARTTRCRHCNKLFASRIKNRWSKHMRGCDRLSPQLRHYVSGYDHKPYSRNLSEAGPEAVSKPPTSPARSYDPESASGSHHTSITGVTGANATPSVPIASSTKSSSPPADNSLLRAADATLDSGAATDFLHRPCDEMTEILLIHGPCSFTRSTWTGGNVTKAGLLREVQHLTVEEEISLVMHEPNHEGAILDWLLNAKENEIIVLCCVGSLTDSPTILRDLELINNRVIVVSLNGVKSRYPTIYSRWCAVGLWAAIVQFGAGCGKESFCPAVDRPCMYIYIRNESSHSVIPLRCGFAPTPHGHVCFSPRCQPTHFNSITRAFLLECRLGGC
ncbi:hypothetical protein PI124_g13248 [Phytophthora idaei]|nr:hypothetical protein PI125_g10883 [Phytophthora idaei]KAG3149780.1 hypothetical protein PI126_g11870 [Phytophthora idaei]KAG3241914.1 hypothetical protein PI124_g13248 [Phytophthora idaei]